jgi:hypothetical protein
MMRDVLARIAICLLALFGAATEVEARSAAQPFWPVAIDPLVAKMLFDRTVLGKRSDLTC